MTQVLLNSPIESISVRKTSFQFQDFQFLMIFIQVTIFNDLTIEIFQLIPIEIEPHSTIIINPSHIH